MAVALLSQAAVSLPCCRTTSTLQQPRSSAVSSSSVSALPRSGPGPVTRLGHEVCNSFKASFAGDVRQLTAPVWTVRQGCASGYRPLTVKGKAVIQFIRGINEQSIPEVKLTRSSDASNGVANFEFDQPSVFDSSREMGDITGIYMIDDEGVLSSVEVNAMFVNGKPAKIVARYVMRNTKEWDRFMRFMENYANENGLGFVKS